MATSWTYTTLKTALKNHEEEQGDDFAANIDDMIKLGEDMVLKDLPLTIFDGRGDVSLAAGGQSPDKPSGCIVAHTISYTSAGETVIMTPRRYDYLRAVVRNTTQAMPKWFANDYSETKFWIAPSPNVTLTAEALMTKRPDSIVTAATSWLGTNVGDLLFMACLIKAELYGMADERVKVWRGEYNPLMTAARRDFAALLRLPYMGEK